MAHNSSTTGELSQLERGPSCDSQHPPLDPPHRSLLSISYQLLSKTWSIGNGSSSTRTRTNIHTLDNYSLLNVFHFCRPAVPSFLDENEVDVIKILGGGDWNDEGWWYSVVKVCRRWRYLVLESASLLGLSILCTYGIPVADMLANSPPLPIIIDYHDPYEELTPDDEVGITLALWQCDRVRWIRLMQPVPVMARLLMIMHGEYPNLEYLILERHPSDDSTEGSTAYTPTTFRAPRLRYSVAMGLFFLSTIHRPYAAVGNPVSIDLLFDRRDYFHPNVLLQQLLVVPRRETTGNTFDSFLPITRNDIRVRMLQKLATRRVTPYSLCFWVSRC